MDLAGLLARRLLSGAFPPARGGQWHDAGSFADSQLRGQPGILTRVPFSSVIGTKSETNIQVFIKQMEMKIIIGQNTCPPKAGAPKVSLIK